MLNMKPGQEVAFVVASYTGRAVSNYMDEKRAKEVAADGLCRRRLFRVTTIVEEVPLQG